MERYFIWIGQKDGHWVAECPAFNVTCDAGDSANALLGCRKMCIDAGREILLKGQALPAEDGFDKIFGSAGMTPVMAEFSLEDEYKNSLSAPVRRTVSLPEWLDRKLRAVGADASRLFQDAAVDYLKRLELERRGVPKISDYRDLEDACAPGVLDEYCRRRFESMGREYFERRM